MTGITYFEHWVDSILIQTGVSSDWVIYLRLVIFLAMLFLVSAIAFFITRKIIIRYIYKWVKKSAIEWDDLLADRNVLHNFAHIVPAIIVRLTTPTIFGDFAFLIPLVIKITDVYLIIVAMMIVLAFLKVGEIVLSSLPSFRNKPLTSYFQLIRIIIYITTAISALSVILGKSPVYFISAFGAMTAIVLLVFKDTILGLVASVQISSNDMVRVGDWVEMPKFNADGDVIAINLNTVKVQNWDKTITTIPTYYFITDSFKNWRGMVQSGGRRIKRALYVNAQTIRFVDADMREQYKKYHLIAGFIEDRQHEIDTYNQSNNIDTSVLINGRRMTNIGVFRKYTELYLQKHPQIRKDMTILVRQLATETSGIPLEIYCFTSTTAWSEYEAIQSDIFDHLFSAAPHFGLEVFQQPSGTDITRAIHQLPDQFRTNL